MNNFDSASQPVEWWFEPHVVRSLDSVGVGLSGSQLSSNDFLNENSELEFPAEDVGLGLVTLLSHTMDHHS